MGPFLLAHLIGSEVKPLGGKQCHCLLMISLLNEVAHNRSPRAIDPPIHRLMDPRLHTLNNEPICLTETGPD